MVLALRLPFIRQAVQGDDLYYLYGAQHAQIDPLHPTHAKYLFQGDLVDMRGHSHGPLNSWILGGLLAFFGSIRVVWFHLAYMVFSIISALSMWALARRFCGKPIIATMLFLAVPAFVVNGNSFESDLPFLAFWMAAVAFFVYAVDNESPRYLLACALCSALAALAAYQAVFLVPIFAVYLYRKQRDWTAAWVTIFAGPIAFATWQIFERITGGSLPAGVLAGYLQSHPWNALPQKIRNAVALTVHCGWIVSPILVRAPKLAWAAGAAAALGGVFYDSNPMFWLPLGLGVAVLGSFIRPGMLGTWVIVFFTGALIVFFAGSARYLLPIAAPVVILAVRASGTRMLAVGFALQMILSLSLAAVNYEHWGAYRTFVAAHETELSTHRTWIDAEWGLAFYLEAEGAIPLQKGVVPQPGDLLVTSELGTPVEVNVPLAKMETLEVSPLIPLRLFSLTGKSAYSVANRGLRAFEFSSAPIDRVQLSAVTARIPILAKVTKSDRGQIVNGWFPDGWTDLEANIVLKRTSSTLVAEFYIPPSAAARRVQLYVDGHMVAERPFPAPGNYTLSTPNVDGPASVNVTVRVDKTFTAPPDTRKLGMLLTSVGFE